MSAKAQAFQQACRARLILPASSHASSPVLLKILPRGYATLGKMGGPDGQNTSPPSRRAITVTTDDGRYNWSELSTSEKAARTTQQSFNFLLVTAGAIGTIAVSYFLYQELFAADSKTRQFNHAVDRVKADARCRELLGPSNKIIAYGEPTSSKWARARPLAHSVSTDKFGTTHFRMHFHMEGPDAAGVVNVHMTKKHDENELQYRLLSLNVPGNPVVFLENEDGKSAKSTVGKMFGLQWTSK